MQAINRGEDAAAAARATFGDLAQLDKDLNRYLNRPLAYVALHQPMQVEATITIIPLAGAEDALVPLRLQRLSAENEPDRMATVRTASQKLAATYPDNAGVWYEVAAAEWGMGDEKRDLAAARTAVDKAIALKPDHVRANVLLGRLIAVAMDKKGDYSAGAWSMVRKPIMLANRTSPDDPIPLYAYFRTFADQGVRPPEIALKGLEKAFSLEPENVTIRISNAFALANQGRFNEAIGLAESVAFDPHDRGQGRSLLDQLEAMRGRFDRLKAITRTDGTGDGDPVD
jgi:predicted Zn-dependent protease